MAFEFSREEIQAVESFFPKLKLVEPTVWEGEIDLSASYDGCEINDLYQISVTVHPDRIPDLREIGGRTLQVARKYDLADIRSLHCAPDSRIACLCTKQEELKRFPVGSDMVKFLKELAVPYLYGLSFYEVYGKWPWKEYSHGVMGLLEYEADEQGQHTVYSISSLVQFFLKEKKWPKYREQLIHPKGYGPCPCGSRIPFYACHNRSWIGLQHLHRCMDQLGIRPKQLFFELQAKY